jgi:hypothetical protein
MRRSNALPRFYQPESAMPKEIVLNAFDMNCVGHIQQGLWTHPRDQSARYTDLQYWTDYARKLEAGLFDGIFFADAAYVDARSSDARPGRLEHRDRLSG